MMTSPSKRARTFADSEQLAVARNSEDASSQDFDSESGQGIVSGGYIRKIELIDFMCHRKLVIDLCANINFLVGANGSGKSAVLTALAVCLGGRASATQRGSSLFDLVRNGASSATIRVTIDNSGEFPFPGIQGDSIIIERHLQHQASTFKILDHRRRVVGTTKSDVDAICDHYAIQIDNPLTILTQETAKRFLANSHPTDLYEFFMRSTQLEQLSIDYAYAQGQVEAAKANLESSVDQVKLKEAEANTLEQRLMEMEKLRDSYQNLEHMKLELTWAKVVAAEEDYQNLVEQLNEGKKNVQALKEKFKQLEDKRVVLLQEVKDHESSISLSAPKLDALEAEKRRALADAHVLKGEVDSVTRDLESLESDLSLKQAEMEDLQATVQNEEARRKEDLADRNSKKKERDELSKELRHVQQRISDLQQFDQKFAQQLQKITNDRMELEASIQSHQQKTAHLENRLRDMNRVKENRLNLFGHCMNEVLQAIRNSSARFHRQPIGPAGMHINLRESKWDVAMTAIIGKQLKSFLVHDNHDLQIMQGILKKFNLSNVINIMSLDRSDIDISQGKPDSQFTTALDVLDISNDFVRKMLIINCSVERTVLETNRKRADAIAALRDPRIYMVYTPEYRIRYYGSTLSTSALRISDEDASIFTNVDDQLHHVQLSLQQGKSELQRLKSALKDNANSLVDHEREQKEGDKNLAVALRDERDIKSRIRTLSDDLASSENRVARFAQADLEVVQEAIQQLLAEREEFSLQKSAKKNELKEMQQRVKAIQDDISTVTREQGDLLIKSAKMSDNIRVLNSSIVKIEHKIEAASHTFPQLEDDIKCQQENVQQLIEEAQQRGPRVTVSKSVEVLSRDCHSLETWLRDQHSFNRQSPQEAKEELMARKRELRSIQNGMKENHQLIETLESSLQRRNHDWELLRKSVAYQSNNDFIFMLHPRGFQGKLDYVHGEKKLYIRVIPQNQRLHLTSSSSQATQGASDARGRAREERQLMADALNENRDIRQLSGGEKSYATSCFLCSLWPAIGSPIRCMDEFDVFMDSVNRDMILDIMIKNARQSHLQFLLITPNAIPQSLCASSDVLIHRLQDPTR